MPSSGGVERAAEKEDDGGRQAPAPERDSPPFTPSWQRHHVAVPQHDDAGPGGGRRTLRDEVPLSGLQGGGDARAAAEVTVEAIEEVRGLVVAQSPEAGDDGVG